MPTYGRTWWGQRFLEALEQFTDPGRLRRGRAYATNGRIVEHTLKNGTVTAKVRGSINEYFGIYEEPIYKTTIKITQFAPADWSKVIARITSRADLVTRLLQQEMPDTIEDVFGEDRLCLLPVGKDDFVTSCSCPDWDNPCKHVAGVYYLLAKDLDQDPLVLFELRGLSREALHTELVKSPLGAILAGSLTREDVPLAPAESLHTRPTKVGAGAKAAKGAKGKRAAKGANAANGTAAANGAATDAGALVAPTVSLREFWMGARRLVPGRQTAATSGQVRVPALLVKKQGDNPPFWHKDSSFISVMEELYERVRTKNLQMK